MASVDEVLDGSESELKSEDLSSEEDWSRLSSVGSSRPYPTYQIGGVDGAGTLRLEETPEEMDFDLIVVYEFFAEGEDEIVTNVQDEVPDIHTVDLPYNRFDDEGEAEAYMDFLMDYGVEDVLRKYGVRPAKSRTV